jgi:DNA-binding response OmpR family regulator
MRTILVIDDESHVRQMLTQELERIGYRVLSASDGTEGLKLVQTAGYDLVILDLILPGANGLTLLEVLRAHATGKDVPVIVLSNLSDTNTVQQAMSLGAAAYLVKSEYRLSEIIAKIQNTLGDTTRHF